MTLPLVTIVTPSFNQREFLEESILSVLEQDYPAIEYFVIDDGSTDGSPEVIERHADRLSWWTVQPNAGQVATINRGFARASGKYIGWINSDDTLLPGAVRSIVEALEASEAVMAFGGIFHTDEDSRRGAYYGPALHEPFEMLRTWTHVISQQGSLFSREAFERVGPLDESRYYVFDAEFHLKLALTGKVVAIDEPVATYRFHEASHSMTQPVRRAWDHVRLVDDIFAWEGLPERMRGLEAHGKAHAYLWAARLFYTGGEHGLARRYYLRALRRAPALATSRAGLLLRSLLPARVHRLARPG
jgi:glycosyltransferase involved in cell wall biosynthesis